MLHHKINPEIFYLISFIGFVIFAIILQLKWHFINDASTAIKRPYSFARVQLVWWTFIVFAIFIPIIIATGEIPTLNSSTLILLGIGVLTTSGARLIDISNSKNAAVANDAAALSVNQESEGFFLDILSDNDGISVHRLQAFVFNLVFGIWFIYKCAMDLRGIGVGCTLDQISNVIPIISDNNLILLGLSSGTYVALKAVENKS